MVCREEWPRTQLDERFRNIRHHALDLRDYLHFHLCYSSLCLHQNRGRPKGELCVVFNDHNVLLNRHLRALRPSPWLHSLLHRVFIALRHALRSSLSQFPVERVDNTQISASSGQCYRSHQRRIFLHGRRELEIYFRSGRHGKCCLLFLTNWSQQSTRVVFSPLMLLLVCPKFFVGRITFTKLK